MTDILNLQNLSIRYGAGIAVSAMDLALPAASVGAVLGANGAGKSSLLKAVAGLVQSSGDILFEGRNIGSLSYRARFRMGIVYVPEGREIVPGLSVDENLILGSYFERARVRAARRDMVLGFFPEIAGRLHSPAGLMSGGEQQMLAIGRALMSAPKLLLLDEPSLGLAPRLISRVMEGLANIQREQKLAAVLVEQSVHTAAKLANQAWFMRQGKIVGRLSHELLRSREAREQVIDAYLGAHSSA